MTFGSPAFLFVFMPIVFVLHALLPMRARNLFLALASLLFYATDAIGSTLVLILSVGINHGIARRLHGLPAGAVARRWLWCGIALNLAPLLYYKYAVLLQHGVQDGAALLGHPVRWSIGDVFLPAGISFFTFQGISYLVDVYRRETPPAPSLIDFAMYHTLFPQLIAGPIVRYAELETRIRDRSVALNGTYDGLVRFCIGLAKKIIIADTVAGIADRMFALPPGQLGTGAAWLGASAYALQILFDFSGYSDMAIGMGQMLGFRFPENFAQPYAATSITEFWRRWHMTLSRWFRDYVYIPLGGNRAGAWTTYRNLLVVFALCGLWHGAAYTFLAWGLFHGAGLVLERGLTRAGLRIGGVLGWIWTLAFVISGWVLFRADSLSAALHVLHAMWAGGGTTPATAWAVLTGDRLAALVVGCAIAVRPARLAWPRGVAVRVMQPVCALALYVCSVILIAANGFNPFIYFHF